MSEREELLAMLGHASAPDEIDGWRKLEVAGTGCAVTVRTGPDDAVARFGFSADGRLETVSVDES
jgi:hypothetical protein